MRICERCQSPFFKEDGPVAAASVCAECTVEAPGQPADETLLRATETELLSALEGTWAFVGSEPTRTYLERLAREVARRIPDAPTSPRVVLVADPRMRTLAFPSGTLLVSLGTLEALEDEASLAFVLGHELAHAASPGCRERFLRLALRAVAERRDEGARPAASEALAELLRLGYGDPEELEADARAARALAALQYDLTAVGSHLERLGLRIEAGGDEVADLALAHPPVEERLRRLAPRGRSRIAPRGRVNREVFRRAVGPFLHGERLERVSLADVLRDPPRPSAAPLTRRALVWIGVGIALLTCAFLLFALL